MADINTWPDFNKVPEVAASEHRVVNRLAIGVTVTGDEFLLNLHPADAEMLANKLLASAEQARRIEASAVR